MNVTFDTNVLLSATLWQGSVAQKLLFRLIEKKVIIYSSNIILDEYAKVLARDFSFSNEEVSEALHQVLSFVTLISPKIELCIVKEDISDNRILECAVASKSKYLITYDKHLLKLKKFNDIMIVRPEETLMILPS